jgi:hypothetical protein
MEAYAQQFTFEWSKIVFNPLKTASQRDLKGFDRVEKYTSRK